MRRVPHPTTLMKLTTRCGDGGGRRAQRGPAGQGGAGEAAAHRPDPGGHHGGGGQGGLSDRFGSAGQGDAPDRARPASGSKPRAAQPAPGCGIAPRAAGQRAHSIAAKLRTCSAAGRDEAQATVRRVTGELAEMAATAADEAERLLVNAKRALRRARAEADELRKRGLHDAAAGRRRGPAGPRGQRPDRAAGRDAADRGADPPARWPGSPPTGRRRRVSLHDVDARPIAKGRLGKPGGVRLQGPDRRQRRRGRPRSHRGAGQSARRAATGPGGDSGSRSAPGAHRARSPPTAATAKPTVDQRAHDLGVTTRGDPAQRQTRRRPDAPKNIEKPSAAPSNGEPVPKAGSATSNAATAGIAPASTALEGARTWTGHGVFAHNLVKISALAA